MKITKIWDAADASAVPGRAFTASLPQEPVPTLGTRLDFMKLALKGAISTAGVAIETFAQVLQPFTFRKGGATRLVLMGDELAALSTFIFGNRVAIGEATAGSGNDFIGDIRIPVFDAADAANQFLVQADRVAQTNVATETIGLTGYFDTGMTERKPIHAVRIPMTTSAVAGMQIVGSRIPAVGNLLGMIVKVPNGFSSGNIDTSIQRLKIYDDTQLIAEFNDLTDAETLGDVDYYTPTPYGDLMRQFRVFRFGETGIDASKGTLSYAFDVQDPSDNVVVIPVLEITAQGL